MHYTQTIQPDSRIMAMPESPSSPSPTNKRLETEITPVGDSTLLRCQSSYGAFECDTSRAIHLPAGLIGLADIKDLCLVHLPSAPEHALKLLQSITPPTLSFLCLPIATQPGVYNSDDLKEMQQQCFIDDVAHMAIVGIVSARSMMGETRLTVNLRAPVVINTHMRTARQLILTNNRYEVQQSIAQLLNSQAA